MTIQSSTFGITDKPATLVDAGLPRGSQLPTAILENGSLSPTSLAEDCFVRQQFSSKLQVFMIGYVNSIYSDFNIYK